MLLTDCKLADIETRVSLPQIYRAIGSAISDLRRSSKMTQQEVADAIGLSRASIANIERGEQRIFVDQLDSFAKLFSLSGMDAILQHSPSSGAGKGRYPLSGDKLKRVQKREVASVLEDILSASASQ